LNHSRPLPPTSTIRRGHKSFVYDVFVIREDRAKALRDGMSAAATAAQGNPPQTSPAPPAFTLVSPESSPSLAGSEISEAPQKTMLRVKGLVPPELWNRFKSKIIPKLRSAEQLQARVELTVEVETSGLASLETEILQVLADLDLGGKVVVKKERP
jgi:hypothetical protein